MSSFENGWALTLIVFLPAVGAAAVLAIPKAQEEAQKWTALLFAGVSFVLSVIVAFQFDYGRASEIQFGPDSALTWIGAINSNYAIGIDGISLPLLVLSTSMTVLSLIYSWNHWPEPHNPKVFSALILVLATGMAGTFVALDLILFFVFFEVVLLPMYFMIGIWGDRNKVTIPVIRLETEMRLYAAIKFFLFTLFGSALMLVSFLALFFLTGAETFSITGLADGVVSEGMSHNAQLWVFGGMLLGFGIKVPMFPFHTWLPDAHTQAPTQGSVILAAVLLKLGTYGIAMRTNP